MSDVEIPDQAYELMEDMYAPHREQAARIIVAAELRRLAAAYDELHEKTVAKIKHGEHVMGLTAYSVRDHLLWRVDELDPEGLTRD